VKQRKKRKRGRRPKPVSERKVSSLTIRLLGELRSKLEESSRVSGRSMSEEVAWRVTMSYLLSTEIRDLTQAQHDADEAIIAMLARRGWDVGIEAFAEIVGLAQAKNPEIFVPPRLQALLKKRREIEFDEGGAGKEQGTATPKVEEQTQPRAEKNK